MIARHRFDIAVLAEVEPRSSADSPAPSSPFDKNQKPSATLHNNLWFWIAVGGWAVVGTILFLWLTLR